MLVTNLIAASAAIIFSLGAGHLALTYFSRAFAPRDAELEVRLKLTSPIITRQTSLWHAQIGFHASHSLGALFFGSIYFYLATMHGDLLRQSPFLLGLGFVVLLSYLVLARLYWFIMPLLGITLAFACYTFALGVNYLS